MNHFKKLVLATVISLAGLTSAHALQSAGTLTPIDMINTTGGGTQWIFSDAGFTNLNRSAGQTFLDAFVVNVPDDEIVYFSVANLQGVAATVSFSAFDLSYLFGSDLVGGPVPTVNSKGVPVRSFDTDTYELTSGEYEFDVYGKFTTTGGSFVGDAYGVQAVPEPAGWALLLAGLGATGLMARRRNRKA